MDSNTSKDQMQQHDSGMGDPDDRVLLDVFSVLESRRSLPTVESGTARLLAKGRTAILRKVSEEALEVILEAHPRASVDRSRLVAEMADLWYHTMVLLLDCDCHVRDVLAELRRRRVNREPRHPK